MNFLRGSTFPRGIYSEVHSPITTPEIIILCHGINITTNDRLSPTFWGNGYTIMVSLSIRRFWGKGERWKRKRERAEGEKCLTQMLLLEPSTPTQHDSKPSNQNHFRSLGCQFQVSKSSPKINLTLRSGRAPVLVLLQFRFFLKPPVRSF